MSKCKCFFAFSPCEPTSAPPLCSASPSGQSPCPGFPAAPRRESNNRKETPMKNGILILHKEEGMTSQTAVARLRRLFGGIKAGHTGTLDPMATGVLPVMLGNATRAGEFMLSSVKHYDAILRLGLTTDTEDTTGTVLTRSPHLPTEKEVQEALCAFRGEILQTPPMYSALKVGGRKLVDLARQGVEVERDPRPITVYALTAERLSESDYRLSCTVSKGTYIRTLCADIGAALGVGGVMAALCRTRASGFSLEEAVTLSELEAMSPEEREARILPVHRIFRELPRVDLSPFFARLAKCGCPLSLSKLRLSFPVGGLVTLWQEGRFFALAECVAENRQLPDSGPALKPIRQFPED